MPSFQILIKIVRRENHASILLDSPFNRCWYSRVRYTKFEYASHNDQIPPMEIRNFTGLYDLGIGCFRNPHHPLLLDPQSHPGLHAEEESKSGNILQLAITFGRPRKGGEL